MKNSVGNAANVISALSNAKINVKMIDQGSSELNIIVGVRNRYFEAASAQSMMYLFHRSKK